MVSNLEIFNHPKEALIRAGLCLLAFAALNLGARNNWTWQLDFSNGCEDHGPAGYWEGTETWKFKLFPPSYEVISTAKPCEIISSAQTQ